ncbi:PilX N-terminal domain-containing pilus assembly protein [Bacillus sp. FJAT-27445]|uniref:PilX N-terminal domain-containing pilus assembly protein n=1 Tax=Bacillus sp. FJAT-27445 TaxID=1679166 RepID=UPI000744535D|nr:PilX N-terminal domain-containing pilus assembly protein [Bacillus sp. FJAT-27445]
MSETVRQAKAILKNEKGMAMVLVLLVLVVIVIMGLSMMAMAANNMRMGTVERSYQSAYYIAEAGATARLNEMSPAIRAVYKNAATRDSFFSGIDSALELGVEKSYTDFEESFGDKPVAKVKIEKLASDTIISYTMDYKITSTGMINNRKRTVSRVVHVSWKPKSVVNIPADTVLFGKDSIVISNTPIDGSIATNATKESGNVKINGNEVNISDSKVKYDAKTPVNLPPFPGFSVPNTAVNFSGNLLKMNRDMVFKTFSVNSLTPLTIDVGDYNRNLVVQNLDIQQNGQITIIGKGKLSIFAENIKLGSGSVINTGKDLSKLYLFLKGPGTSLDNGLIYGSMYANDLQLSKNANLAVSVTTGVQGHIITGGTSGIKLSGSPILYPRMIYAPSATVDLDATFTGSIIANKIISNGANKTGKYEYVQINYENSPIYVDTGGNDTPVQDSIVIDPIRETN